MSMGQKRSRERPDPCAHTDVKMMLLRCGEMLAGHHRSKLATAACVSVDVWVIRIWAIWA